MSSTNAAGPSVVPVEELSFTSSEGTSNSKEALLQEIYRLRQVRGGSSLAI